MLRGASSNPIKVYVIGEEDVSVIVCCAVASSETGVAATKDSNIEDWQRSNESMESAMIENFHLLALFVDLNLSLGMISTKKASSE